MYEKKKKRKKQKVSIIFDEALPKERGEGRRGRSKQPGTNRVRTERGGFPVG